MAKGMTFVYRFIDASDDSLSTSADEEDEIRGSFDAYDSDAGQSDGEVQILSRSVNDINLGNQQKASRNQKDKLATTDSTKSTLDLPDNLEKILDEELVSIDFWEVRNSNNESTNRGEKFKTHANSLLSEEKFEEAVEYYSLAIECDSSNAIYFANRSLAHFKWENYGCAASDATKAIELDPEYAKAYFRRGCAFLQIGKVREAKQDFEEVLSLTPHDKSAQAKLKECEKELKQSAFRNAIKLQNSNASKAPANTKKQDTKLAMKSPPSWTASGGFPKLVELCGKCIANEVSKNVESYLQTFKDLPGEYLKHVLTYLPWAFFETFRLHPNYSQSAINASNKYEVLKEQENYYRRLFATCRNHPSLEDPYLMLIDAHAHYGLFTIEEEDSSMQGIPKLFDHAGPLLDPEVKLSSIVGQKQFFHNFNAFTDGQLLNLDWNNVLAAGGSVLACLIPTPMGDVKDFYDTMYKSSDIDLFIYGLDQHQANEKLMDIYQSIQSASTEPIMAFRTLHCITIVSSYPRRHIQIVLRLYKSPAEILMGFDIDCCSVGFDGEKVWVHPRAAKALKYQVNTVDLSRRSPTYETRLFKYSKRGFRVAVPGFDRSRVKPNLFICRQPISGLTKLLFLESVFHRRDKFGHRWNCGMSPSRDEEKFMAVHNHEHASDYANIRIPYGPRWTLQAVVERMRTIVARTNDYYYRLYVCYPPRAEGLVPCVFGSMVEVLEGAVNTGQEQGKVWDEVEDMHLYTYKHVDKHEMWMTDNPGSFHPIDDNDWDKGVYK